MYQTLIKGLTVKIYMYIKLYNNLPFFVQIFETHPPNVLFVVVKPTQRGSENLFNKQSIVRVYGRE